MGESSHLGPKYFLPSFFLSASDLTPLNSLSSSFFSLSTFFISSKLRSFSELQLTLEHLKVSRIVVLNSTPSLHNS